MDIEEKKIYKLVGERAPEFKIYISKIIEKNDNLITISGVIFTEIGFFQTDGVKDLQLNLDTWKIEEIDIESVVNESNDLISEFFLKLINEF